MTLALSPGSWLSRHAAWATLCVALGCAPSGAQTEAESATPPIEEDTGEPFRALSPTERVPAFRVRTTSGSPVDSRELVGKSAFVVVFFATWCQVCEMKLPMLSRALEVIGGDIPVIGVSVDEPSTWHMVDGYLRRLGFEHPTVRATDYPRFSTAYDPVSTVPAVAIVGRNGYLVDYQLGYGPSHPRRLLLALRIARDMPADAPPLLARPPEAEAEPPAALDPVDSTPPGTELDADGPSR